MSQIPKEFYETESGKQLKLAYKNMKARCYGKMKHCDHNYGARGITVCNEWLANYEVFITWALENGFKVGLSLDRKNNDLGYSPNNCRWITRKEQLLNQRRNRLITFNSKTQTLSQWAEELNIRQSTLWRRLYRGIPLERALKTGRLIQWKHGTRAGYELHKCRCKLCIASNTKRHQIQREKRKSKNGN